MQAANRVQDGLHRPPIGDSAVSKLFQVNFVEVNPGSTVLQHLWGAVPVETKAVKQPAVRLP